MLFDGQYKTLKLPLWIGQHDEFFKAYFCAYNRQSQAANADAKKKRN